MAKTISNARAGQADEHHLVEDFRRAIDNKDLVTMGQMLELLGSMRAELLMGKPVIDKLTETKKDGGAGGAPAKAAKPRSLMARLPR